MSYVYSNYAERAASDSQGRVSSVTYFRLEDAATRSGAAKVRSDAAISKPKPSRVLTYQRFADGSESLYRIQSVK